jgi:Ras-related GTP-binding protein A/B
MISNLKKIPGTLFKLAIQHQEQKELVIQIWYRDQLVFEKSGVQEDEVSENIQNFFMNRNLTIPRNRVDRIVQEIITSSSAVRDEPFLESSVTNLMEEIQKRPADEIRKIILIGLSNAGKTCIYERVFEGKKPWELLHSAATKGIAYKEYDIGKISKPMIWDLGGQEQYLDEYHGALRKNIFRKASILLYVIDITDVERYEKARKEFEWSVSQILTFNPKAKINVFLHKMDLIQNQNEILAYLKELFSKNIDQPIYFHSTSIFGQSLFAAWSEIIRELSPKTTFINTILKTLKNHEGVKDAVLLEKSTGLACGSTLDLSNEGVAVGMLSLLIVTIDKVTREMKLQKFEEFKLKTETNYILMDNVTDDLLLIIILTNKDLGIDTIHGIEQIGKEVARQIKNLWTE